MWSADALKSGEERLLIGSMKWLGWSVYGLAVIQNRREKAEICPCRIQATPLQKPKTLNADSSFELLLGTSNSAAIPPRLSGQSD